MFSNFLSILLHLFLCRTTLKIKSISTVYNTLKRYFLQYIIGRRHVSKYCHNGLFEIKLVSATNRNLISRCTITLLFEGHDNVKKSILRSTSIRFFFFLKLLGAYKKYIIFLILQPTNTIKSIDYSYMHILKEKVYDI